MEESLTIKLIIIFYKNLLIDSDSHTATIDSNIFCIILLEKAGVLLFKYLAAIYLLRE